MFEMEREKRSFTQDLFLSLFTINFGLALMEFGQQKSQFRISMQTPVENPLMTIESFNRQFQIGEKERKAVKWGVPWSNPYGSGLTYPGVDAILPVKAEEGVTPWQYTLLHNKKREDKMDTLENTPNQTETQSSSPDQSDTKEEPIVLSELFPDAQRDLDALFPDPSMKKFLKELVQTRKTNNRFLKRLAIGKIISEESEEDDESA